MNTETASLGADAPHTVAPEATRQTLRTLMRREFWEHTALWLVPLIVAAALAVVTVFAKTIGVRVNDVSIQNIDADARIIVLNMSQMLWVAVLYVAAAIVGDLLCRGSLPLKARLPVRGLLIQLVAPRPSQWSLSSPALHIARPNI